MNRRNLFLGTGPQGQEQIVLIDWATAGRGAIGQELAAFVGASVALFAVEPADVAALDAGVFAQYVVGLRAAGWLHDPRVARLGYTAALAVLWGSRVGWVCHAVFAEDRHHARWAELVGQPIEEIADRFGLLLSYCLDRADEARVLMEVLG